MPSAARFNVSILNMSPFPASVAEWQEQTLQTWTQKPSHVRQMTNVFYHADYLRGLRFLETCTLWVSVKEARLYRDIDLNLYT